MSARIRAASRYDCVTAAPAAPDRSTTIREVNHETDPCHGGECAGPGDQRRGAAGSWRTAPAAATRAGRLAGRCRPGGPRRAAEPGGPGHGSQVEIRFHLRHVAEGHEPSGL